MRTTSSQRVAVVADDDGATRRILTVLLERHDYAVWVAVDGQGATNLIQDKRPDVVFLDAHMPGADGYEVCRAIRADETGADQPWVFMITAAGQDADRQLALESGVDQFLTKPFSPSQLSEQLRQLSQQPDLNGGER